MEKKKILFVLNQMGAGGIAKSLSNLLFHLEKYKDEYDVDLFLLRKDGCFIKDIPNYVNVLEAKGILKLYGASQKDTKKFGVWQFFSRFCVACWSRLFTNKIPLALGVKQNKLNKEYDMAISFAHTQGSRNMTAGSVEFVLNGVKAKKKFAVCHGDVEIENLLTKGTLKDIKKLDKFFSVSRSCSEQVVRKNNKLKDISDYLYNTQRNDIILNKSISNEKVYEDEFNMVMVSRLENQKAHMRFLPIVKKLADEGHKFKLNIIGDGILRPDIENYIQENNMNSYVKLFGQQSNPFPFIKQADLFVLVSYYEAAPMVYNESQLIGTPIFTTKIISAEEMVGDYGFICENNEDDIYKKLKFVLENKNLIEEKKEKLKNYTYDNDAIVKKLLNLIN